MLSAPKLREHLAGGVRPDFFIHMKKKSGRTLFTPLDVAGRRA
jgi:hypothetical protein